jgi:hypothetical protein
MADNPLIRVPKQTALSSLSISAFPDVPSLRSAILILLPICIIELICNLSLTVTAHISARGFCCLDARRRSGRFCSEKFVRLGAQILFISTRVAAPKVLLMKVLFRRFCSEGFVQKVLFRKVLFTMTRSLGKRLRCTVSSCMREVRVRM